eukprot:402611-Pelagomonas_calceolata.AAC.5
MDAAVGVVSKTSSYRSVFPRQTQHLRTTSPCRAEPQEKRDGYKPPSSKQESTPYGNHGYILTERGLLAAFRTPTDRSGSEVRLRHPGGENRRKLEKQCEHHAIPVSNLGAARAPLEILTLSANFCCRQRGVR